MVYAMSWKGYMLLTRKGTMYWLERVHVVALKGYVIIWKGYVT